MGEEAFLALEQEIKMKVSKTIALKLLGKCVELETIDEVTGLTIGQLKQLQSHLSLS